MARRWPAGGTIVTGIGLGRDRQRHRSLPRGRAGASVRQGAGRAARDGRPAPDAFFGGAGDALSLTAVGNALVAGETLFVNTYLIGVTTFAAAGRSTFARYSAELAGVEAEHRVLAQTLLDASPPNNVGFELFRFDRVHQIKSALEGAGVGFGRQGTSAGRFYDFPRPPMPPPIPITSNTPR